MYGALPAFVQAVTTGLPADLDNFTVTDSDGGNLTLTLTASNGTINNLTDFDVSTPGIQIDGTAAQINAAIAGATFTATTTGNASIALSVTDGMTPAVTATYEFSASAPPVNVMTGGPTNDTLNGSTGNDSISGLGGNDWLRGHEEADTLIGGDGRDDLYGGSDNDLLEGGALGTHADTDTNLLNGEDGNDIFARRQPNLGR